MVDSSGSGKNYPNSGAIGWVKKHAKFVPTLRHLIYQLQLFNQGRLRIRGLDIYLNSPDRIILEDDILLFLASYKHISKVLFVGCDWYTKPYRKIFKNQEYWTIEPNAKLAKYGSEHHIVDVVQNLPSYCDESYFDLIVCNGVFGYGLNTVSAANEALDSCFRCLNSNGILVIGWNNVPESSPFLLDTCQSIAQFKPYVFPALASSQYVVTNSPNNHTFNFYVKPAVSA